MENDTSSTRRKVLHLDRLPTMPQVALEFLEALADEQATAARLEKIIESDQALTSKVLSLANSAYYGFSQQVTTIQRAVVAVGFRDLRLLALGAALSGMFDPRGLPKGFDGQGLWLHSLSVSLAARDLADEAGYPQPGEMLAAGLLHDVGKLVLFYCLTEEAQSLLDLLDQGLAYHEAEAVLGLKHTVVGSWLARKWGLPPVHLAAIRDHHSPKASDPYYLSTCLISLADHLVKEMNLGLVNPGPEPDLQELIRATSLRPERIKQLTEEMGQRIPPLLEAWQQMNGSRRS